LAKHVGTAEESDRDFHGDYLAYARKTNALLGATALASLGGVGGVAWRVDEMFQTSPAAGREALQLLCYVVAWFVLLILFAYVGIGIPGLVRVAVLRRRFPHHSFYALRLIPGFWGRLVIVDPEHDPGRRLQNATLSLDGTDATIWRGLLRPHVVSVLPLASLANVKANDAYGLSHRRRILVLTFQLGLVTEELPLAIRTMSSFGGWRVSTKTQTGIIEQLKCAK
jgi:hypothetical protein